MTGVGLRPGGRAAQDSAPVVVAARRTVIGTAGRGLADLSVEQLAAPVLAALVAEVRGALGGDAAVDDVVLGSCAGPGGNVARVSALAAGLGLQVPGVTVDRQCASGLAAIVQAGHQVAAGAADLVLAGGAESASTAPLRVRRGPDGESVPYERAPFAPAELGDPEMGVAADHLASRLGISRERQDAYAVASHAKVLTAHAAGRFDAERILLAGLDRDERARRLDLATLGRMRPAFVDGGSVTGASSSPLSDGAAAVAVLPRGRTAGMPGLALIGSAIVGCDPRLPGLGPVAAVRAVLERAGIDVRDVAAVEVVEAFASQVLALTDALGLDPLGTDAERVCADGGALGLGHPWGASGAVSVVRLFSRLVRGGAPAGTLGLATAAAGGGLGVAALFEVVR